MIVEADPASDRSRSVLDAVEALAMGALLLERSDHALDHAVIRHDEIGALAFGPAMLMASRAWGIGST